MEIIRRGRAGVVKVLQTLFDKPVRRLLELRFGLLEPVDEGLEFGGRVLVLASLYERITEGYGDYPFWALAIGGIIPAAGIASLRPTRSSA